MTVKELKIFETYHQPMEFVNENSYYSMKYQKKRATIVCNKIIRKNT